MASADQVPRVAGIRQRLEGIANGTIELHNPEYEEKVAAIRKKELQLCKAPIKLEPAVSRETNAHSPNSLSKSGSYCGQSRQEQHQEATPPPSPLQERSSQEIRIGIISQSTSPSRRPSLDSPVRLSISRPTHCHTSTNPLSIEQVELQLADQKEDIKQLKLRRDESDLKIESLQKQLDEALKREESAASEIAGNREEVKELRATLADERAEVRRLNDEIKEMVKRERELVDMLLEVQTRRRKDGDSSEERQKENVIQKKEGKTRMRIERSNSKSKGQKGKLQVVRWKTPSGA